MKTTNLLETLRARGVVVEAPAADRLRIEAPRGALSAADVAELKRLKPELLALLAPQSPGVEAPEPSPRPTSIYPRAGYDPVAAREYADREPGLTEEQRAALRQYAAGAALT